MVSVQKLKSVTLKGLMKQKQHEIRMAQAAAAELRLQNTIKNAAKSVYPKGLMYLQVGRECGDEFVAQKYSNTWQSIVDFSESDWAPWSKIYRITKARHK